MLRQFATTSARRWTCWGASTGGSLALQLIADRPDVVRKAVVASAAYALGPLAKELQLKLLHAIEETGRYPAEAVLDLMPGKIRVAVASGIAHAGRVFGGQADHDRESGGRDRHAARRGCLRCTRSARGYPD